MVTTAIFVGTIFVASSVSAVLNLKVKVFKLRLDLYYLVALSGAALLIAFKFITPAEAIKGLTLKASVNPLKILALFFSMTFISVYLDEAGLFRTIAAKALKSSNGGQFKIITVLYLLTSVLTVFTSNDIIVLTFTPFICTFCKHSKVNPVPYLFTEFVAANTFSMALIIGNPTNIYLASFAGIDFFTYLKVMILPTVAAGLVAYAVILLVFKKSLSKKIESDGYDEPLKDKTATVVGVIALSLAVALLSISNLINIEMYIVSLVLACALLAFAIINAIHKKDKSASVTGALIRLPYSLVPFLCSMFICVLALDKCGFAGFLAEKLSGNPVIFFGVSSFLAANVMNNIPMSVLFSAIAENLAGGARLSAVYASIVGSNLGAYLTPVGALAGIMFSGLIRGHGIKFTPLTFIKYGALISAFTLAAALLTLLFTVNFA